jgi:HTH-type transcriptional regulator / antitoxin HigA
MTASTSKRSEFLVRPIKTEADYEEALDLITTLLRQNPQDGSPEDDHLLVISSLVYDYEERQYPMGMPDPIGAIRCRMEDKLLTEEDLVPYIGPLPLVQRILAREEDLTLEMVRRLTEGLGIPVDVLAQRYPLRNTSEGTSRTSTRVPPSKGRDQETAAPIKSAR